MNIADRIARTVLYEGYLLYPYTLSSTKNRQRWTFGGLHPQAFVDAHPGADAAELCCQCLVEGSEQSTILTRVRFLQLVTRTADVEPWEEAIERDVPSRPLSLASLCDSPQRVDIRFPEATSHDGQVTRAQRTVEAELLIHAETLEPNLFRLTATVRNTSRVDPETRREALLYSLVSTHILFASDGAEFVSAIDPPDAYRGYSCKNIGTFPVLIGNEGERGLMLSSPIILYDYPQLAPESPGDLFDATEIDEILSLRIRTLTDAEKAEIRASDPIGRALLERTEALTEDELLRMHGTLREADGRPRVSTKSLEPGTRVRLRPKTKSGDAFDLLLAGQPATICGVEQDLEGKTQLVVAVDGDPGSALEAKAQLGHRFFFSPDEVEPL